MSEVIRPDQNEAIQLSDPVLRDFLDVYQDGIQREISTLDAYQELRHNIYAYNTERISISADDQEAILKELWKHAGAIGECALDTDGTFETSLGGVRRSKLSRLILEDNIEANPDLDVGTLKRVADMWRTFTPANKDAPVVPYSATTLMFKQFKYLAGVISSGQNEHVNEPAYIAANEPEWMAAHVTLSGVAPPKSALATLTGLSYLDTLRALVTPGNTARGVLTNGNRKMLEDMGKDEDDIALYNASAMLDFAQKGSVDESIFLNVAYRQALIAAAGLGRKDRIRSSAFVKFDFDTLPPTARLIYNANAIVADVHRVKPTHDELVADYDAENGRITQAARNIIRNIALTRLADMTGSLRQTVQQRLSEKQGDVQLEADALTIEAANIENMQALARKITELGVLTRAEQATLSPLFQEPIKEQLIAQKEAAVIEARRTEVDALINQLAALEQPYAYTAKKIRSFADGTTLIRELRTELGAKQLLSDDESAQSLAMLVLLSGASEDKPTFYDTMNDTRLGIEPLLRELQAIDPKNRYKSGLVNVLDWVDEIIDAGTDVTISNNRLRQFIDEYYIGPDAVETDVLDNIHAPLDVDAEMEAEPDSEAELPIKGLTKEANARRKAALESYTTKLAELLQVIAIPHADVDAFPPGSATRSARQQHRRAQEQNASFVDVDPARLENLIRLKNQFEQRGHAVQLMFTNPTSWRAIPPFVLYVQSVGDARQGVYMVENPVNGNASYVGTVDGQLIQQWSEIVRLPLEEARAFGARAFVHPPKGSFNFDQHYSLKISSHMSLVLNDLKNS
jgi:hypothetical protein